MSSLVNLIIQARREAYNALNFLFILENTYIHFFIDRDYQGSMKKEKEREKEREYIICTILHINGRLNSNYEYIKH